MMKWTMSPITFQFYVFGPPRLCIDDDVISLPPQPAALCAFLILNRQRRITREEVQVAFWPTPPPPAPRNACGAPYTCCAGRSSRSRRAT